MDSLIVKLEKKADKAAIKRLLRHIKGIKDVSEKISKEDFESLLDLALLKEIKKTEKDKLYNYSDSKKRFSTLRKSLAK
jgi:hypothetical protein